MAVVAQRPHSKQGKVKVILSVSLLGVLALAAFCLWKLHPWMPAGETVHVRRWKFWNSDFEVWQRKNDIWSEPFSTALFVREGTNHYWDVFSIGHQDCYLPPIELRENNSVIEVFHGRNLLGVYAPSRRGFLRDGAVEVFTEGRTESPADWWRSPQKEYPR